MRHLWVVFLRKKSLASGHSAKLGYAKPLTPCATTAHSSKPTAHILGNVYSILSWSYFNPRNVQNAAGWPCDPASMGPGVPKARERRESSMRKWALCITIMIFIALSSTGWGAMRLLAHEEDPPVAIEQLSNHIFLPIVKQTLSDAQQAALNTATEHSVLAAANDCPPVSALVTTTSATNDSDLWGATGDVWDPLGRLPDFSYAGYRGGAEPIPLVDGIVLNVKEQPFYAVGDGITNDTQAFRRAINVANRYENGEPVIIYVPAGRYILTDTLQILRSNTVLRGEGAGQLATGDPSQHSILHFKTNLELARDPDHSEYNHWGYGDDGMVQIGDYENNRSAIGGFLAVVAEDACRGARQLRVSNTVSIAVGSYVMLMLAEELVGGQPTYSLWRHLHNEQAEPPNKPFTELWPVHPYYWIVQVVAKTERTITLAQPLRHDVIEAWQPRLYAYEPVQEVGIEQVRVAFDDIPLENHHNIIAAYGVYTIGNRLKGEHKGYNGIGLRGVLNSWVTDVTIENADNALSIGSQSKQNTVQNLWIKSRAGNPDGDPDDGNSYFDPPGSKYYSCYTGTNVFGHHGLLVTIRSHDNLITNFVFDKPWSHDAGFTHLVSGNVIRNGQGHRMSLSYLTDKAFENLYSNIHVGDGIKWNYGSGSLGPKSGARATYWNIQANNWGALGDLCGQPQPRIWQSSWRAVQSNLIGGPGLPALFGAASEWNEPITGDLVPQDLHQSQLCHREPQLCQTGTPTATPSPLPTELVTPTATPTPTSSITTTVTPSPTPTATSTPTAPTPTSTPGDPLTPTATPTADVNPPETFIDDAPDSITSETSARFTFSADERRSTFRCSLDGAPLTPCTAPLDLVDLAVGVHLFRVQASDRAGNSDPSPARYTWTIEPPLTPTHTPTPTDTPTPSATPTPTATDTPTPTPTPTADTVAPDTFINGAPEVTTTETRATFVFTANDRNATFRCSLDDAPFTPCVSPLHLTNLTIESHEFRVRAVDQVGNGDSTPARYTWTVEPPPTPTITPTPTDTPTPTATLTPTATDTPSPTPTPTLDTTAPDTFIDAGPETSTTETTALFTFSASDHRAAFRCSLDGARFADCTSPVQLTDLTLGVHEFRVRAVDAFDNGDPTPARYTWSVEPPPPPADTPTAAPTATASPNDPPLPTTTPTGQPTNTPAPTSTPIDAPTLSPTDTPMPTATPTTLSTPSPTVTPLDTPTPLPTDTAPPTDTPTQTSTPTPNPSPTETPLPSASATPAPTSIPLVAAALRHGESAQSIRSYLPLIVR